MSLTGSKVSDRKAQSRAKQATIIYNVGQSKVLHKCWEVPLILPSRLNTIESYKTFTNIIQNNMILACTEVAGRPDLGAS